MLKTNPLILESVVVFLQGEIHTLIYAVPFGLFVYFSKNAITNMQHLFCTAL
jgi:hypothetical protein